MCGCDLRTWTKLIKSVRGGLIESLGRASVFCGVDKMTPGRFVSRIYQCSMEIEAGSRVARGVTGTTYYTRRLPLSFSRRPFDEENFISRRKKKQKCHSLLSIKPTDSTSWIDDTLCRFTHTQQKKKTAVPCYCISVPLLDPPFNSQLTTCDNLKQSSYKSSEVLQQTALENKSIVTTLNNARPSTCHLIQDRSRR